MLLHSFWAALPLAAALPNHGPRHRLVDRQFSALNYSAIDEDFYPGGRFGLSNQIATLTNFVGLGGAKGNATAAVRDLEFVFPSLKTSGYAPGLEKGLKGGLDGFYDTVVASMSDNSTSNSSSSTSTISGVLGGLLASGQIPDAKTIAAGLDTFKALSSDMEGLLCATLQDTSNQYLGYLSGVLGNASKAMDPDACEKDTTGGTGLYASGYKDDPSLRFHTVYAPKNIPKDNIKLPVIVWGNAGCFSYGAMFANMLTEIASHGFLVISSGAVQGDGTMTHASDLTKAINWVFTPAAKKYGNIDLNNIAVAGQGCGALEALSASYKDPRVKFVALFNGGVYEADKVPLLKGLTAPIGYFGGGTPDFATPLMERDYATLEVPVLKANIDLGIVGTYYQKHGGTFGKAATEYFNWQMKGDLRSKALFCNPLPNSTLIRKGWRMESKNGMC